jgi:hypothetical protein
MQPEVKKMLFDIAKTQDAQMQNVSSELGVKTSLYLVFSVFLFNTSFQINNFASGFPEPWSERVITLSMVGAVITLVGALALLAAALIRDYRMFPVPNTAKWIADTDEYARKYPDAELQDQEVAIREILDETVSANKSVNQTKGWWINLAACILFVAVPIVVLAGIASYLGYLAKLSTLP